MVSICFARHGISRPANSSPAPQKNSAPQKVPPCKNFRPESVSPGLPRVPKMIGSVIGIYNDKVFNNVMPDRTGHHLGEFSCSYRPIKHGCPGVSPLPMIPSCICAYMPT
ncbi:hypothetical protein B0H14DRAFT_2416044 [Mycena olivaceomarginata]|nr:hypothetical protein B0H14DRAFT_2416044 [Mycena olivaceomarginata]